MLAAGEQRLIVNLNDLRIFQAQLATEYDFIRKMLYLINLNDTVNKIKKIVYFEK